MLKQIQCFIDRAREMGSEYFDKAEELENEANVFTRRTGVLIAGADDDELRAMLSAAEAIREAFAADDQILEELSRRRRARATKAAAEALRNPPQVSGETSPVSESA